MNRAAILHEYLTGQDWHAVAVTDKGHALAVTITDKNYNGLGLLAGVLGASLTAYGDYEITGRRVSRNSDGKISRVTYEVIPN